MNQARRQTLRRSAVHNVGRYCVFIFEDTSNQVMEEPMDSLKTIQKIFRIFLRLTHAAKILCIVGTVLSGAGALCLMTS